MPIPPTAEHPQKTTPPPPENHEQGRTGTFRHAIVTTMETPSPGTLVTYKKPIAVTSIGTRYSALRPFVRKYISPTSRVLMVGCGNSVMSEDMVKDGFADIVNIDISSVAIDTMRKKYADIPQLKYLKMDVRDMSFFPDDSFDSVIDKGTLDSLMCGTEAPLSSSLMLGGSDQITYGNPSVRMPFINRPVYNWKVDLYIIPRPGFQRPSGSNSSLKSYLDPVPTAEEGLLPADYVMEDPDSHFIYVCKRST